MSDQDRIYSAALQHLISCFNMVAPTGEDQRELVNMIHADQERGASHKAVLILATWQLINGLGDGEWPTNAPRSLEEEEAAE